MAGKFSRSREATPKVILRCFGHLPESLLFWLIAFIFLVVLLVLTRFGASASWVGFIAWLIILLASNEAGLRLIFLLHLKSPPTARVDAFIAASVAIYLLAVSIFIFLLAVSPAKFVIAGRAGAACAALFFTASIFLIIFRIIYTGITVTRLHTQGRPLFGLAVRFLARGLVPLSGRLPALRWWDQSGGRIRAVFEGGGKNRLQEVFLRLFMAGRYTAFDEAVAAHFAHRAHQALLDGILSPEAPSEADAENRRQFLLALGNSLLFLCFLEEEKAKREASGRDRAQKARTAPPQGKRRLRSINERPMSASDLNAFFVYAYLDTWMELIRRDPGQSLSSDENFILAHLGFSPYRDLWDIEHDYDPENDNGFNNAHLYRMAVDYRKIARLDADSAGPGDILAANASLVSEIVGLSGALDSGASDVRGLCLEHEAEFLASALLLRAGAYDRRRFLKMAEEWDMVASLPEDVLWMAAHFSRRLEEPAEPGSPYRKRLRAKTGFLEKRALCAALGNGLSIGFVPGYVKWKPTVAAGRKREG
ncbi:MAG: hypothetical protein HZB23_02880 [Deltaproteobacteria bacterium]|nr:hypothetical protein [Deltaproteobacteria bacterium]